MRLYLIVSVILASFHLLAQGQPPVDSTRFFTDETILDVTLTTDMRKLRADNRNTAFQPATIRLIMPDSSIIQEAITVAPRGKSRREICRLPPLMLNFRTSAASRLRTLGKLKLVIGCGITDLDEQLLLKEYLVYKMYNILEEKSFRVRLLRITYTDSKGKLKTYTQYGFLIEDDGDMARRNNCKKKAETTFLTESTNRDLMTKLALFQYMIGNTDWAVPNNHNIKLIYDRIDKKAPPYVVPYDFDYCGLVNADYAVPHESIGTNKVTERVYRGFPRTMEELQIALDIFRENKSRIQEVINGCTLISPGIKKDITGYLKEFFSLIEDKKLVKLIFIDNARIN